MTLVCRVDGVGVARSRSGRWVHVGQLPREADPEHEVDPVEAGALVSTLERELTLRDAALDMMTHHDQLHPSHDCPWAQALSRALR